jgi:PTH2 family peptidyl-tRNA hydrolase
MIDQQLDSDIQELLNERERTMAFFHSDYKPLNMYAIFRADLEMSPGKLAAQAGHAFDMTHDKAKIQRPEITSQYKGSGNGTKICMYAKNLNQLIRAYRDCQSLNIPCELIIDRGHILLPHFNGKPIITGLGIGPAFKEEMTTITKRYTMLK